MKEAARARRSTNRLASWCAPGFHLEGHRNIDT